MIILSSRSKSKTDDYTYILYSQWARPRMCHNILMIYDCYDDVKLWYKN